MRRTVFILVVGTALLVPMLHAGAAAASDEVAPGLKVGDVLDQSNWEKAKDLLPPETLQHYKEGHFKNRLVAYPTGNANWEAEFKAATEKNAGQLDVDDVGTIVYSSSKKQPDYYYGLPFPVVDAADPKAGVKVVWNMFLSFWQGGNTYNTAKVTMLSPTGVDRDIVADGWWKFYEGQLPRYRDKENPLQLQSQFLGVASKPADLQGTASLTWRYRDPGKRDSQWAYVPALRRVRAVSPANRSDGYLGSDISADDGFFFDGKPEDFNWSVVGKRDALVVVDPNSVSGPLQINPAPGGGWITLTDLNPPSVGYLSPGWTGVAWAPSDSALAKRQVWVVQGVPKDKYYLYGKLELWIDAETWAGSWNRKFSWAGEMVHNYQATAKVNHAAGPENDREWVPALSTIWSCAENLKMNRATVAGMRPYPNAPYYRRIAVNANQFESNSLNRFGK